MQYQPNVAVGVWISTVPLDLRIRRYFGDGRSTLDLHDVHVVASPTIIQSLGDSPSLSSVHHHPAQSSVSKVTLHFPAGPLVVEGNFKQPAASQHTLSFTHPLTNSEGVRGQTFVVTVPVELKHN